MQAASTRGISPEFQRGRAELYRALLHTLTSSVAEEGFVGPSSLAHARRRRLTHQYIAAMLACGFPANASSLQRPLRWLLESGAHADLGETTSEFYLDLDKIEAATRMGEGGGSFCGVAIDLLLKRRRGANLYDLPQGRDTPFFALWCAKILLQYRERQDCFDAATETLEFFSSNFGALTPRARDLSFLVSLYATRWPETQIHSGPLSRMLDVLMSGVHECLFDVGPEMRLRLGDLLDGGLAPDVSAGIEEELHWSLVSTCYVIENMTTICDKSEQLESEVSAIAAGLYRVLTPAIGDLSEIFKDQYRRIMLAARAVTAFAVFTGEHVAKAMVPHFLDESVQRNSEKQDERAEEKQRLQDVLKEWLTIDWDDTGLEPLSGGYSGATVVRVRPVLKIPGATAEGYHSVRIPYLDSVIVKYGQKVDLDKERENYASIPPDFRHLVASIPSQPSKRVIDDQVLDYLVIEDLIGYRTVEEILRRCTGEFQDYLLPRLIDFLEHFYRMPSASLNSAGMTRHLYFGPMYRSIETIHQFKHGVTGLDSEDYAVLEALYELTRSSDSADSFHPTVMHGDLNIRNILVHGRQSPGAELRFRLIDLETFTRSGDFAYDIGEFSMDIEESVREKRIPARAREVAKQTVLAFEGFARSRDDGLFGARYVVASARSLIKLIELRSADGIGMLSGHPLARQRARRLLEEEVAPLLGQAYAMVAEAAEMLRD